MTRFASAARRYSAALRILLMLTVLFGVAYPLAITAVAQIPGLKSRADGSLVSDSGKLIGSRLIGQPFTDDRDTPLPQYLQGRPSAAGTGATGYDPTASAASNLGPESIVDGDKPSLLTEVCSRSLAIGRLDGVDGARPFCTPGGVGALLGVFYSGPGYQGRVVRAVSLNEACPATPFLATYGGVSVECATPGQDYTAGKLVPIRGRAPAHPAVPPDAVTASGSGLDPEISPQYAELQAGRIARARGVSSAQVLTIIDEHRVDRDLGFLGEPRVNTLEVNLDLDRTYPVHGG
jgi:K+-transporting ATPase ATPase C chain